MDPKFFRKYADLISENEIEFTLDEKAPPGMEDWVRKNKQHFIDQYGKEKGPGVLYATAWKRHKDKSNEDLDYTSAAEPMNEYHGYRPNMNEKYMGFGKLEKKLDKNPKVRDPAAVAAAIGRKKYGQAEMTRKSVAGRKG